MNFHPWLFAAAMTALAAPALAQPGMPPPSPPPGYSAAPAQPPTPADQSDRLRQALRLRPDQERALNAFVAAMRGKPGEAEHFRDEAGREAALPTPRRLDAMLARMDEMRASLIVKVTAIRAFYAQLDPQQRQIFDHMPPPGR